MGDLGGGGGGSDAVVLKGDGKGCPTVDYCNFGRTYVDFLTAVTSGITSRNCDVSYTKPPKYRGCQRQKLILVYDSADGAVLTSVPLAETNHILKNAEKFCTPSKDQHGDTTLVFQKGHPYF